MYVRTHDHLALYRRAAGLSFVLVFPWKSLLIDSRQTYLRLETVRELLGAQ